MCVAGTSRLLALRAAPSVTDELFFQELLDSRASSSAKVNE